jgi:hypothetical protein
MSLNKIPLLFGLINHIKEVIMLKEFDMQLLDKLAKQYHLTSTSRKTIEKLLKKKANLG